MDSDGGLLILLRILQFVHEAASGSELTDGDTNANELGNFSSSTKQLVTLSLRCCCSYILRVTDAATDSGTDLDNTYQVTVRATDFEGNNSDQSLTVTVTVANEINPLFGEITLSVKSTTDTAVHTFTSDETVSWSLSRLEQEVADFAINSTTGAIFQIQRSYSFY